jgi:uncharacterized membrane protein
MPPPVKLPLRSSTSSRADGLDALRGVALVWMAAFHFCFDLQHFHLLTINVYQDPFWTWQRALIVSLFLLCAGMGQALAFHQGQSWLRFWRRWAQIAACAVLVSIASWWMFPRSFITFGVLHGMALMLILTRLVACLHWPRAVLCVLGGVLIALPQIVSSPLFDSPWTNWIGLVTHLPVAEDYVPLLPWWGVMLWGLAGGQWLIHSRPQWLSRSDAAWAAPALAWLPLLGRWSLSFYMLHQLVLMGAIMLFVSLWPR